jgi:hypothetical protein
LDHCSGLDQGALLQRELVFDRRDLGDLVGHVRVGGGIGAQDFLERPPLLHELLEHRLQLLLGRREHGVEPLVLVRVEEQAQGLELARAGLVPGAEGQDRAGQGEQQKKRRKQNSFRKHGGSSIKDCAAQKNCNAFWNPCRAPGAKGDGTARN